MNIELTPRAAAASAQYAELTGMNPEEFLNALLEVFLVSPSGISTEKSVSEDLLDPFPEPGEPNSLGLA